MTAPLVVVGGGPAGAAAACVLGQAGLSPLVVERDAAARHRICGEFLSWEAQAALASLGIDLDALGASRIAALRLVHRGDVAACALPFVGRGLTRRTLDAALIAEAAKRGAVVRRGVTVRGIEATGDRIAVDAGGGLDAGALILASGKHDVRGLRRDTSGTHDDLVGFKTYFALAPEQQRALDGHVEVMLFDGGYAGLQLVEGRLANLCLLVDRATFDAAGREWRGLFDRLRRTVPYLGLRLDDARERLDQPLAISGVPYGFVYRASPADHPRLHRVGDQLAVIPSFSGDGLSIALVSGIAAARAVIAGDDARRHHDVMASRLRAPVGVARLIYRLGRQPAGRSLLLRVARAAPGLIGMTAGAIRVPGAVMAHAGLRPVAKY